MKKFIIILFVIFLCSPTYAQTWQNHSGNSLYPMMQEYEKFMAEKEFDLISGGYFLGYVSGASDAFTEAGVCCSIKTQPGQLAKVVIKYLKDHPDKLHNSASSLIEAAITKAWPCQ